MGYVKSFFDLIPYHIVGRNTKLKIQDKRIIRLLKYAKAHSPFYSAAIPDDLDFKKIKPITKVDMIEHFDSIVTDSSIKLKDITKENFSSNKYTVAQTSGSTGNPIAIVENKDYNDKISVESFFSNLCGRFPIIFFNYADDKTSIALGVMKNNLKRYPILKKLICYVIISQPFEENFERIKDMKNGIIVGYATNILQFANDMLEHGDILKSKEVQISGEHITEAQKNIIRKAFDCDVKELYGCTEAAVIGKECKCGHIHINENVVKIEPVDENMNVIGYGQLSDGILLTNYLNYTQPIIRYLMSDRVILHKGSECSCGNKSDWIELEGRKGDVVTFEVNGEEVVLQSVYFADVLDDLNFDGFKNFKNYQIVINHKRKLITFILDYYDNVNQDELNKTISEGYDNYLGSYNINDYKYKFVNGLPKETTLSGKHKRIVVE